MTDDYAKLFGYYNAHNVDSTEIDAIEFGWCTSVEICTDDGEWVQIGFYYDLDHVRVEKVSVLKKGHHYEVEPE